MPKTIKELREEIIEGSLKSVAELIAFSEVEISAQGLDEGEAQYARRLQLVSAAKQKASFDAFKLMDKIEEEKKKLGEAEVIVPTTTTAPTKPIITDFNAPEKRA